MRYALLIHGNGSERRGLQTEERTQLRQAELPAWRTLLAELGRVDRGAESFELRPPGEARVVRVRRGETIVSNGPIIETSEALGGLFLIDLPDLDEAIRLAALVPAAGTGSVEIRPVAS